MEKLKAAIINARACSIKVLNKETRRTLILVRDLEEDVSALDEGVCWETQVSVLRREGAPNGELEV